MNELKNVIESVERESKDAKAKLTMVEEQERHFKLSLEKREVEMRNVTGDVTEKEKTIKNLSVQIEEINHDKNWRKNETMKSPWGKQIKMRKGIK